MRRFLPGEISCSSCSGDRAPKNLSIRSALDLQARRAESIIRISKDSLACMAQFSFPAHYQRSPQSAVPPFATGRALTGKRAVGTCAPVAEFLVNSQNQKPLAILDGEEHLNDAGIFG